MYTVAYITFQKKGAEKWLIELVFYSPLFYFLVGKYK